MQDRTRTPEQILGAETFVEEVFEWLRLFAPLFEAIAFLRQLPEQDAAVEALLEVPVVKHLRLSWELWEALAIGAGYDADDLLEPYLGEEWLSWLRFGLWGVELPPAERWLTIAE